MKEAMSSSGIDATQLLERAKAVQREYPRAGILVEESSGAIFTFSDKIEVREFGDGRVVVFLSAEFMADSRDHIFGYMRTDE